ncbi:hypothetical protein [Amycolatopsis azurea]|uniref:Uncharacterized protein n=1 Tax=Amycolatopsis azurea DSM 43854 TaxID=1238180 RepID=M2PP49_9PSEU|nr:hypothetical protein [Amycolatopsis azurea]EMD26318.1 hypothetical protein C791_3620 [Amycolatopsis azurea DSM 43854]OOC07744.1 hypothetical protein B0293_06325 [Amycolatopsis azurea DSM 43854]
MSGDGIKGDTDAMREFSALISASIEATPVSPISRIKDSTPCPGGLFDLCQHLTSTENETIPKLQTFITMVEQGFAAYASFVQQTAMNYIRADEAGRREILTAFVTRPAGDLPEIDPRLLDPRAGQR